MECIWGSVLVVFLAFATYFVSSRSVTNRLIDQEMYWLFGDAWRTLARPEHYLVAQERIYRRRNMRWVFALYAIVAVSIMILILLPIFEQPYFPYDISSHLFELGFLCVLIVFTLRFTFEAFPTRAMLQRREWRYGEHFRRELETNVVPKAKHLEKVKRGQVRLSDDGELIDVEDHVTDSQNQQRDDRAAASKAAS